MSCLLRELGEVQLEQQKSRMDNVWGSDGSDDDVESERRALVSREIDKISSKLYNDGYRIGKAAEEERLGQACFDRHYARGAALGSACGEMYSIVLDALSRMGPSDPGEAERTKAEVVAIFTQDILSAQAVYASHVDRLLAASVPNNVVDEILSLLNAKGLQVQQGEPKLDHHKDPPH